MSRKVNLGLVVGIAALVLLGASFVAGVLVERRWLSARRVESDVRGLAAKLLTAGNEDPRREAFLQYLDGKTIDLKGPSATTTEPAAPHVIRKDQVKAVRFPDTMAKLTGEPWRPEVHLILDTEAGRYFVRCVVPYHEIEKEYVFLGLEVQEVARQ